MGIIVSAGDGRIFQFGMNILALRSGDDILVIAEKVWLAVNAPLSLP